MNTQYERRAPDSAGCQVVSARDSVWVLERHDSLDTTPAINDFQAETGLSLGFHRSCGLVLRFNDHRCATRLGQYDVGLETGLVNDCANIL